MNCFFAVKKRKKEEAKRQLLYPLIRVLWLRLRLYLNHSQRIVNKSGCTTLQASFQIHYFSERATREEEDELETASLGLLPALLLPHQITSSRQILHMTKH